MEGMTYAQRAMEMALHLGDSSLEAAANRAVAGKLYAPGNDITCASQSLERALELAEAGDDASEAAECCFSLARAYYWLAEIERSQAVSSRMVEFIERSQQPYQLCNALPWIALLHASRGEWEEAKGAIERARPLVEGLGSSFPSAFLHQNFAAFSPTSRKSMERPRMNVGPQRWINSRGPNVSCSSRVFSAWPRRPWGKERKPMPMRRDWRSSSRNYRQALFPRHLSRRAWHSWRSHLGIVSGQRTSIRFSRLSVASITGFWSIACWGC